MWGQTGREKRSRDLAEPCLLCNLPRPLPCSEFHHQSGLLHSVFSPPGFSPPPTPSLRAAAWGTGREPQGGGVAVTWNQIIFNGFW